jgi:hypothetical protein
LVEGRGLKEEKIPDVSISSFIKLAVSKGTHPVKNKVVSWSKIQIFSAARGCADKELT